MEVKHRHDSIDGNLTEEKICREELSLPCKGYGECVLWSWARDEKRDCLDGSDLGEFMDTNTKYYLK